MSADKKSLLKYLAVLVTVVAAVFGGWRLFIYEPTKIPPSFLEAKREGAIISQTIVGLTDISRDRLQSIGELERKNNRFEAVNLVLKDFETNKEARDKAFELSKQLQKMTEAILEISPAKARVKAQEAVSYELSLISGLITYNQLLYQLLEVLKFGLNGDGTSRDKVNELVEKINKEIKIINELNGRFNQAMAELDSYF